MNISLELVILVVSILFFFSIMAGKAGYRLGVPALLLFLMVGMLCGSDGLGIRFDNIRLAQGIGTFALCMILFSGGLDTKMSEIKPIIKQGVVLATLGVFLTAIILGVLTWWILGMTMASAQIGFITSLLLASIMSSTDSASVFSILRNKGLHLKNNLKPLLELESGSNDPMAYLLTITVIEMIKMGSHPNYWQSILMLVIQLVVGGLSGYLLGKSAVRALNRLKVDNTALYPILLLAFCLFIYAFTYFIKGNGFLAVYIAGLVVGNSRFTQKRTSLNFFDGLAWISQLIMFLVLGLLVNPKELIPLAVPALIISFLIIFIARPVSVFLSLLPFRKMPVKDKVFVSWVGLRGAVPIIFAIIPLAEGVPHARVIFNIVFFCTLISLIVQGTSLPKVALWLGLTEDPKKLKSPESFDVEFSDDIDSISTEITVTAKALEYGNTLMEMPLPPKTLVILVKREEGYFVPNGKSELKENDKLLILTDDTEGLKKSCKKMGLNEEGEKVAPRKRPIFPLFHKK